MPDIPAEAVEAVIDARAHRWGYDEMDPDGLTRWKREQAEDPNLPADLAAALPHLHERWLAEVEGALREALEDGPAWRAYLRSHPRRPFSNQFADYMRDVLGAGAGGEGE